MAKYFLILKQICFTCSVPEFNMHLKIKELIIVDDLHLIVNLWCYVIKDNIESINGMSILLYLTLVIHRKISKND